MRDIKEVDGLTFEEIAARTGGQMSTASIQNALAPNANRDLNRETARIIENAIFGVSVADPCPVDLLAGSTDDAKKVADLIAEIADLRKGRAAIHESFDREVEAIRAEAQKKVEFLLAENQRLHKVIDRLLEK